MACQPHDARFPPKRIIVCQICCRGLFPLPLLLLSQAPPGRISDKRGGHPGSAKTICIFTARRPMRARKPRVHVRFTLFHRVSSMSWGHVVALGIPLPRVLFRARMCNTCLTLRRAPGMARSSNDTFGGNPRFPNFVSDSCFPQKAAQPQSGKIPQGANGRPCKNEGLVTLHWGSNAQFLCRSPVSIGAGDQNSRCRQRQWPRGTGTWPDYTRGERVVGRTRLGEWPASRHGSGRWLPLGSDGPGAATLLQGTLAVVCEDRSMEGRLVVPLFPRLALQRRRPRLATAVQRTPCIGQRGVGTRPSKNI